MKYAWENMNREEVELNVRNGNRPSLPNDISFWTVATYKNLMQVIQV